MKGYGARKKEPLMQTQHQHSFLHQMYQNERINVDDRIKNLYFVLFVMCGYIFRILHYLMPLFTDDDIFQC